MSPCRRARARSTSGRIHPISQVMDELAAIFADLGFSIAEGPDIETDDYNFGKLNFPPDHPARDMHDTFFLQARRDGRAQIAAHPYEPGAGAHHADAEAADPGHLPGPHLSLRFRPDPYADVPSGRGARHRQAGPSRQSEMDFERILQGLLRSGGRQDALPAELFSLHRAVDGSRYSMFAQRRRNPIRRRRGLARNPRLRHGASQCAAGIAGSIPMSTKVLPGASGSTGSPC